MSPTVHVPAMLGYSVGNQYITKQITMIGVDETTYSSVSDFGQYLQHPKNRQKLDFQLKHGGYDTIDHQATNPSKVSPRRHAGRWLGLSQAQSEVHVAHVVPEDALDANPFDEWTGEAVGASGASRAVTCEYSRSRSPRTPFDPVKNRMVACSGHRPVRLPGPRQRRRVPGTAR